MIIADLGSDVQFPVELDNWVITGVSMGDSGESTVQGAFWWDGGDYIYRQAVSIIFSLISLPP